MSKDWQEYMTYTCNQVTIDGYWLEFGVFAGSSTNFIANQPKCQKFHPRAEVCPNHPSEN